MAGKIKQIKGIFVCFDLYSEQTEIKKKMGSGVAKWKREEKITEGKGRKTLTMLLYETLQCLLCSTRENHSW